MSVRGVAWSGRGGGRVGWITDAHEALETALDTSLFETCGRDRLGPGVQHQLAGSDSHKVLGVVRRGGGQLLGIQSQR